MPRDYPRARRIQEQIRRELSVLLARSLKDPRVPPVTLTDVEVSKDLSVARVYVTSMAERVDKAEVVTILNGAAGYLRRELGQVMRIRNTPKLRFFYDESIEYGARMDELITSAIKADTHERQENEEE